MGTFRSFHSVEQPEQPVFKSWSGRPGVAALTLVVALASSGCSESEAQPEEPPSTTEPTPSPSSSPTLEPTEPVVVAPTLPPAAKAPGKPGARAQVEHLVALLNHSMLTGETTSLRAASADCSGCRAYADLYENTYRKGGKFDSSTWKVTKQLLFQVKHNFFSYADISVAAGDYVAQEGAESQHFGPRKYTIRVALTRREGAWRITGLRDAS